MTVSIFVDTNVLMELFFNRPKHDIARQALMALPGDTTTTTSILALSTLMYYVEAGNFNKQTAHKFIGGYRVLDMNQADYEWASANDQGDFEDALQIACALRHGCIKFITLDQSVKHMYGKHIDVQTIL